MTRTAFALAALLAATVAPAAASAQDGPGEIVRYADLNLNSAADMRRLAARLDGAVDHACGGQPTSAAEHGANADYRACRQATMAGVLKTIGAPLLTATVEGRRLVQLASR